MSQGGPQSGVSLGGGLGGEDPRERWRVPQAEPKHPSLSRSSLSPHLRPWIRGGGGCWWGEPCAGAGGGGWGERQDPAWRHRPPPKGGKTGGRRGPRAGKQTPPQPAEATPCTRPSPEAACWVPSTEPAVCAPTGLRPGGAAASPLSWSPCLGQSQTPGEGPAGWTSSEPGARV